MKDSSKKPAPKAEPSKSDAKPLVANEPVNPRDPRPRQQIAYEGDDEFSIMSLAAQRRKKAPVDMNPGAPDASKPSPQKADAVPEAKKEDKAKDNKWTFLRKIFGD